MVPMIDPPHPNVYQHESNIVMSRSPLRPGLPRLMRSTR